MAAVLKQYDVGVTLNKKDANGNFKPIVVQTNITTTGRGIFKKTITTYTQTCN
ncbi:MAG: hypothetical protein JSR09_07595 [Bacteroidetes bacterium]|nr:hypothetical protein [Bacteroidota bacterium]MBS1639367.1 hypothetical protein [Bacteroidota bacterium]MBS1642891.1 hypothetical protein [Bacteroidota bacterium]MBS1649556.1 hypothetical protein [Bacteroidota bacterium]MBS1670378.1 hypothetical protein [Bacteroidota bacterium]